jgi:hypothetical protein
MEVHDGHVSWVITHRELPTLLRILRGPRANPRPEHLRVVIRQGQQVQAIRLYRRVFGIHETDPQTFRVRPNDAVRQTTTRLLVIAKKSMFPRGQRRGVDARVQRLVVHLENLCGKNSFKRIEGDDRFALRVVFATFTNTREGRSRQLVQSFTERSCVTFNKRTVAGFGDGSPLQVDPIICADALQFLCPEFPGIFGIKRDHSSPNGPRCINFVSTNKVFFGQNRTTDGKTHRVHTGTLK